MGNAAIPANYVPVLVFIGVAIAFGAVSLLLGRIVRPSRPYRAKLAPYAAYSLQNLKKERRYELCFEAVRWNDLRRWGDVRQIVDNQEGVAITNRGVAGKYTFGQFDFMERYNATGGGFLKIPDSQVTLSEGVLEQNPGWDSAYDFISLPYYAN